MSNIAWDTATSTAIRLDALTRTQVDELPYDKVDQRYRCLDCGERLTLRRRKTDPRFRARFNHDNDAACTAPAAVRGETAEHLQAKELLAGWLAATHPDSDPRIEPGAFGQANTRIFKPDVIGWRGRDMVGIEYQRSALDIHEPADRVRAYRDEVGPRRLHLWLFSTARKTRHYIPGPPLETVRGEFRTVYPTRDQTEIVRAGGSVYWAELSVLRQVLYVPIGAATIHHEPRPGELWLPKNRSAFHFTVDQDEPRRDWRASFPRPDPKAELWLLIPVPLARCAISRNREFLTTPAYPIASAIAAAEPEREDRLRTAARADYGDSQTQLAALSNVRAQAAAGSGPDALALERDTEALYCAAEFAAQAAEHQREADRLRVDDYRLATEEGELASRRRRNPLALAVQLETRAGLARQRLAVQSRRAELAAQRDELDSRAHSAAEQAKAAHPTAASGRAVSEAERRRQEFESLRADAVRRDISRVEERIRALNQALAAYGGEPVTAGGPTGQAAGQTNDARTETEA